MKKLVLPTIKSMQHVDSDKVELNSVAKLLIDKADIRHKDLNGIAEYLGKLYRDIVFDADEILEFLEDNKLEDNSNQALAIDDVIKSYDFCLLGGVDLLCSLFDEEMSQGRREDLLQAIDALIEVRTSLDESSSVKVLEQKDDSVSYGVFSGLFKHFPMMGGVVAGFNGNPAFIIGKWLKQWDASTVKVLTTRVKYLNLELATLEADGSDSPKVKEQKEYYKNAIQELEDEILDLRG
jgi:hypothetical protein